MRDNIFLSSNRRIILTVLSMSLGWVFIYLDRVLIFPLLPVIGEEFGLSDTYRGLIASSYFFFYVLMQTPTGIIGDKYGLSNVVFIMYLIVGISLIGIGVLSYSYVLLLVFAGLHGFGAGAYYPASYGITINVVPVDKRGVASAVVTTGMALGLAIGLSISGPLALLFGSWRDPFLVLAFPTIISAFLLYFVTKNVPGTGSTSNGISLEVFKNKDLLVLSLAAFCSLYGYWVLISWAPTYFVEQRGYDLSGAGQLTAIVAVASVPGALLWGPISDKLGRKYLSFCLLIGAGVAIGSISMASSTTQVIAALGFYGSLSALAWNPVLVAWAGDLASLKGDGSGAAMGLLNAFAVGSSFVGPALTGMISDLTGSLESGFYMGSISLFIGAILVMFVKETKKQLQEAK
ncbi:MAG: MFS transporter [Dehalococcoidia bacterium]